MPHTILSTCPCYIISVHTGTAIDLDGSSDIYKNRVKVQGYALHGKENQQWMIRWEPNGYVVKNVASATYLGIPSDEKLQNDKPVTGNSNRVFFDIVGDDKNGYVFYARNITPIQVLDLNGGREQNGTSIIWYAPHYGPNQRWMIVPVCDRKELFTKSLGFINPDVQKRILNVRTNTCLDSGGANGQIHAWVTCYSSKQRWFIKSGNTGYVLQDNDSKKYLVAGPKVPPELKAEAGTEFLFDGNDEDGYYVLYTVDPAYALEFENDSNTNGIKARLHPSRRHKWYIKDFQY